MFKKDIKITGKHAYILKKYTPKTTNKDEVVKVKITTKFYNKKREKNLELFHTMFDALTSSMLIGFKLNKTSSEDKDPTFSASILADKLNDNVSQDLISRIYQVYLFTIEKNDLTVTLKSIFTPNLSKDEEKIIEQKLLTYAYAGLEYLDEIFKNADNSIDYLTKLKTILQN